jgi:hypothetical protein
MALQRMSYSTKTMFIRSSHHDSKAKASDGAVDDTCVRLVGRLWVQVPLSIMLFCKRARSEQEPGEPADSMHGD